MQKTCLIFNPAAGGARGRKFIEQLRREVKDICFATTRAEGDGERLAAQLAAEGCTTFIAGGGDGTVNEVLNGMMSATQGKPIRLGTLPLGTQNVFAAELGIPRRPLEAWRVIQQGRTRLIDLPTVTCQRNGGQTRRFWVQLAGAGFDARAVQEVNRKRKKLLGPLEYIIAGLKVAAEPAPLLQLEADGRCIEGKFVIVGNGRFYGGPFALFPQASNRDGKFDVCVFQSGGYLDFLRYFQGVLRGVHPKFSDVKLLCASQLYLRSAQPVPLEVDGELLGVLPCGFEMLPRSLEVIVPPQD
jgi:YegS/Rv2252/BmrU family lipid kinase